ncbi:hypothetical protein BC830DRAFT_66396 [Chytriomyces sp. MP71]|nr:hypothetical protein BC830DRAFT_66396 [Chytriomyces sp. MP71]
MKTQREWSDKWGALNDPKLYLGEVGEPSKALKAPPTKWSAYSIINTPKRNPLSSRPSTPDGTEDDANQEGTFNSFKVTGNRRDFLSHNNARHPSHPIPSIEKNGSYNNGLSTMEVEKRTAFEREFSGGFYYDHKSGQYYRVVGTTTNASQAASWRAPHARSNLTSTSTTQKRGNQSKTSLASFNNVSKVIPAQLPSKPSQSSPPSVVKSTDVTSVECRGYKPRLKSLPPELPADKYAFPATSNMEYGWRIAHKKNLEVFGSTSADYAKESWKRAMATQKQ